MLNIMFATCLGSIMDKTLDSGSGDAGSIPVQGTNESNFEVTHVKEKIYTIPVTDAFQVDSECPFCVLENKLEEERLAYYLGGALMEPDCRQDMNAHGFCKAHLDALFQSKQNVLGLGLILTSYFDQYNQKLSNLTNASLESSKKDEKKSMFSKKNNGNSLDELKEFLRSSRSDCTLCNQLEETMKRYISVFYHMWRTEKEFRVVFESKKGFCAKHFQRLLEEIEGGLKPNERQLFLKVLFAQQIENLSRLRNEVKWFTEKFDYQNNEEPWGNSRDAVPRCIEKLR